MKFSLALASVGFAHCILISSSAIAADDITQFTGNELKTTCDHKNYEEHNQLWYMCVEAIYGIIDGYQAGVLIGYTAGLGHPLNDEETNRTRYWCAPSNVTREQSALVVTKYLDNNPEKLNDEDWTLVTTALHDAWPCAKK